MKGQFNVITPGNYNHTIGEIFREPILFGRQIGTPTPRPLSPEIPVYGDHVFSDDENSDDENSDDENSDDENSDDENSDDEN